jgi:hypothetical protein
MNRLLPTEIDQKCCESENVCIPNQYLFEKKIKYYIFDAAVYTNIHIRIYRQYGYAYAMQSLPRAIEKCGYAMLYAYAMFVRINGATWFKYIRCHLFINTRCSTDTHTRC